MRTSEYLRVDSNALSVLDGASTIARVWSVVASVLLASVSPEIGFGDLTPDLSPGLSRPTLAFDGTNYLVVWHDHRSGDTGHIYGQLMSPTGVLIGASFNLLDASEHKDNATVLFDGTQFAVSVNYGGFPALVRVSRTGVVLDPQGIVVSASAYDLVRMAYDGTNYMLVWSDGRGAYRQIRVARITKSGQLLDPGGVLVSANMTTDASEPDIVYDGTHFIVAWRDAHALMTARVTMDAALVAPETLFFQSSSALLSGPRLAGRAGGAVALFLEQSTDGEKEARLTEVVAASTPAVVSTRRTNDWPTLVMRGAAYTVVWSDEQTCFLWAGRFTSSLMALDGDGVQVMGMPVGSQYDPAIGTNGTDAALVLYKRSRWIDTQAFATLDLGTLTSTDDGTPFVRSSRDQSRGDLAISGTRAVNAWIEQTPDGRTVMMSSNPHAATARGTSTTLTPTPGDFNEVGLASDGADRVLVVWRNESSEVVAQLFDEKGAEVNMPQVLCGMSGTWVEKPRVAWDGTQFVVAFWSGDSASRAVRLVRVAASGTPTVSCGLVAWPVTDSNVSLLDLRVAGGNGTVLLTIDSKNESTHVHSVAFLRERAGAMLETNPVVLSPGQGADGSSAAWNGTAFMVVWNQARRWSHDVVGTLVPPTGAPSDSIHPISAAEWDERRPRIAFDGQRALVVWADTRNGSRVDVFGSFVDAQFAPAGPQSFAIAESTQEENEPSVGAFGAGRFAVSYTRFDPSPAVQARRIGLRWVVDLAQAATCAANDQCQSGFCVDGVCCDAACGDGASDCEACSQARGASADGVCTVLSAQTECRASAGECDVAERCDGTSRVCPVDLARPDGLACSGTSGVCGGGVCRTGSAPHFTSAVSVQLTCGESWSYSKAGRPEVAGEGPFTFSARTADGSPLPEGFSIDASTGEVSWRTTRDQVGSVTLELRVESPTGADTQVVQLDVECARRSVTVSCASIPSLWLLGVIAWLMRRRSHLPRGEGLG